MELKVTFLKVDEGMKTFTIFLPYILDNQILLFQVNMA